ncbi:hypothetical protein TSUD_281500 [Trifolium subterraneum]|uniref:Replication protein A 70 kDa DNA-binding subunit B/D first OB fold domain-containing protein n=1 Tax=Trifolium subterraneum TaxID=3900 RepID=A0A2Z6N2G1_TRISU|nr:hypothetical protein TSUD_281500 [Trifolium subterraneum]
MNTPFDFLGSVSPGRDSWRFKVRILRLWNVPSFLKSDQSNSIEMVLIDEKGGKIHASVRRQLVYLFGSKITEGDVYKMSFFTVSPESGLYRPTPHPYKLNFEMKTKVQACENREIDPYGLSLTSIGDVIIHGSDHDFLVDVIAVITGISAEREYIRDGKVTKMIVLELTDNGGKCECALFGGYVKDLQEMLVKNGDALPVFVIQFAKIKNFGGNVSVQNVLNATRIFVNPDIPEVVSFKKTLAVVGVNSSVSIPAIGHRVKTSFEDDFLLKYPRTSIAHLLELVTDGIYVVDGVVDCLVEDEDWWYASCKCHRSLTTDSGAYYCKRCDKHVFKMVPRFRVNLRVGDGTVDAVFVVIDADMNALVEKVTSFNPRFYGSFRVKRICADVAVMKAFRDLSVDVDSTGDEEDSVDVDYVEDTPVQNLVGDFIVSPSSARVGDESEVCGGHLASGVIDLGDDCCAGVEVFVPGRVDLDISRVLSAKRNLSIAFSECDDVGASTSKTSKISHD